MLSAQTKVFFVVNRIVDQVTGLNQAVFERANIFNKHRYNANIISFRYEHGHYRDLNERLRKDGYISDKVNVYNMYEFLKNIDKDTLEYGLTSSNVLEDVDEGKGLEEYENGQLVKKTKKVSNIQLNSDTYETLYYNVTGNNYMVEELDDRFITARRSYLDPIKKSVVLEYYFRDDNSVYLTKQYNIDGTLDKIRLFDADGNLKKRFNTENQLRRYFLDSLIEKDAAVLVADARSVDKWLASYNRTNVTKIAMIHNIHINAPFRDLNSINSSHKSIFELYNKFNKIVVLTHRQAEDVQKSGIPASNISVIPNPLRSKIRATTAHCEAPFNIAIAGRLAKQKRIDHAILAFSKIVEQVDARLNIYGSGSDLEQLVSLVEELNIIDKVNFCGYERKILDKLREADISLVTSTHEGFPFSVIDSISQGCPVIAYNIKYGPEELIKNGMNGWLCEDGNIEQLADKVIDVLSSPEKLKSVKDSCSETLEFVFAENYMSNWEATINRL